MKKNNCLSCLISAILLSIAIIAATVCNAYLPLWVTIAIIFVCIFLTVFIFSSEFLKKQNNIENHFFELKSTLNNAIHKIEESEIKHENNITDLISKSSEDIEQHLSKIEKQSSDSNIVILNSIKATKNSLLTELEHSRNGIEQIHNKCEDGKISIVEKIDKVIELESNLWEAMNSSSKSLISKTSDLSETIISTSDRVKDKIRNSFADQAEFIKNTITDSSSSQNIRFAAVQNRINEIGESLHQAGNMHEENITVFLSQSKDGLEQQLSMLAKTQVEVGKHFEDSLKNSITAVEKNAKQTNQYISQLKEAEHSYHDSVMERIEYVSKQEVKMKEALFACIDANTKQIQHDYDNLLMAEKSFSEALLRQIDVLTNKSADMKGSICSNIDSLLVKASEIQTSIFSSLNEISEKVDTVQTNNIETINAKFKETIPLISSDFDSVMNTINEIKGELLRVGNEQHQNIITRYSELAKVSTEAVEKLCEIQKQHSDLLNLINEDNEEYDKAAETFIDGIHNQYASLNDGFNTLMAKTESIGNKIEELKTLSNTNEVVKSINSAIADLSSKINGAVVDINKKVVESNLFQSELIKDEVLKLQILLRTLLSSTALGETIDKRVQSTSGQVEQKDPNRTESIEDAESKNIVLNQYKNNILVKSTMKNKQGTVIYELVYHNGKLIQSKSYDESGTLRIEQDYYENGQVHFREEYRKDGKHSTEFDNNGHIIYSYVSVSVK